MSENMTAITATTCIKCQFRSSDIKGLIGAEMLHYNPMFRISIKHEMFDLQVVLLMCWINDLNRKTDGCGRQS